jgi:hypothetical protein
VLHLGRRVAFGVDVADFLQLQRPFQRRREVVQPAQVEEVVAAYFSATRGPLVARQRLPSCSGKRAALAMIRRPREAEMPQAAEIQRQHRQHGTAT